MWEKLTSRQYVVFLFMNMEYLSIYFILLLLKSEFCSFPYGSCVYFYRFILKYFVLESCSCSWHCVLMSNSPRSMLIYRKAVTFEYWPCVLQPCCDLISSRRVFLVNSSGFSTLMIMLLWKWQSYVFLPNPCIFYLLLLSYCISTDFQYSVEREWWEGIALLCTCFVGKLQAFHKGS